MEAKLFDKKYTSRENGRSQRINSVTAIYKVLLNKALKGDQRAIELLLKRARAVASAAAESEVERDPSAERAEFLVNLVEKTLRGQFD